MGTEIAVHAVLAELEDGTYKATSPDLGIEVRGKNADETIQRLRDTITRHIRDLGGVRNLRLTAIKCMKIKIQVE